MAQTQVLAWVLVATSLALGAAALQADLPAAANASHSPVSTDAATKLRRALRVAVAAANKKGSPAGNKKGSPAAAGPKEWHDLCDQVHTLGYVCEKHTVETADGFQLEVIRIPPTPGKNRSGYPVVLQHGLIDTAITWMANAHPFQNLATILSGEGYDVWMPNSRGNHYSLNNTKYSDSDPEYWRRIDMDWMARYDFPAYVDYILAATGHPRLSYAGHSQGGMIGFAAFSTWNPSYASKVDNFFALAPACAVGHLSAWIFRLLADLDVGQILALLGDKSFLENDWLINELSNLCPHTGSLCADLIDALCGPGDPRNLNSTQMEYITRYDPGGTSVNNIIHWSQEVRSGLWQTHDYGEAQNLIYYNTTTAPVYLPSRMKGPNTMVWYGGADALADPTDVAALIAEVSPSVITYSEMVAPYAHLDFTWGLDAYDKVYSQIVATLAKLSND